MSKTSVPAKREITFKQDDGEISVKVPDPEVILELFGTDQLKLAQALMIQIAGAVGSRHRTVAEQGRQFMLAVIEDLAPRDAIERLLAVQMGATHASLMQVSAKMNDANSLQQHEVYERSFNRLARTFTAQAEQLRRHRNGGQSKVTVEHVTVNEGGQAIVGRLER